MKLLSIDIGIKNLAFIILETNEANDFKIIKWDVLNLCSNNNNCAHHLCKNKPAFLLIVRAGWPNKPTAIVPIIPQEPCTANAPTGSSISNHSIISTTTKTRIPATSPIIAAAQGIT